ncbi:hypothetical protein J8TS2_31520 [Lederbergia ruris]|uniref:EpsG family protein n=1 Tax=Lederbergia ruris TaxID=217495 RepID=A0ABQ4KLL4_9BACI|nr:EpsG family protein [Lederbergia ruris]GIN58833.1 hypothetical protein J8TS2_31520 [Lederbergia ruris]
MTLFVYLLILFLNLIFAFRNKGSKILTIITIIVIILLVGNAGPGYTFWSDYDNYLRHYGEISITGLFDNLQVLYTALMKAGTLFKLDFFTFRVILTGICFIIIYKVVIQRYSCNSNYVFLLYIMYPMIIDSEQFRNFIAMTILLVAIIFLEKDSFKGKLKFLILVFVATAVHTSFIFYAILIFVNTKHKNKLIKTIAVLTIFFSIVIVLNNNQIPFIQQIINLVDVEKAEKYLSTSTDIGFLIPVLLQITNLLLLNWARKIIARKSNSTEGHELINESGYRDLNFSNLIFWINVLSTVFIPLFIMNVHFYRLIRNLLILNFIIYGIASNKINKGSPYKFAFNTTVIGSVALWLIMDLVVKTPSERLLIPFFTENLFLN